MRGLMIPMAAGIVVAPLAGAAPALAQASEARAPVDVAKLVAATRALLNRHYVLPALRPKFDAMLAEGLAAGRYADPDPEAVVRKINADLGRVTPDKHLGLMYDPAQSRALAAAPPNAGADDAPPSAADIANAAKQNHGLVQLKLLPGNIRYLETTGFVWAGEPSERAYDDAMRFLAGGDAVIIDMRRNGGGDPSAVRYMVSHFLPPNRPLMTFYMGSDRVDTSASLPALRAPRMVGKPLYVLTSGGSASAAEEFIGHVAGYKLGEIIGEKSAGAGFRNEFFALPEGMVISISVGRAVLASTGKDWEGVGIAPTTVVPVDKALETAQVHALRRLAQTAAPADRPELEAAATLLAAQVQPVATALPLAAYAGTFGERSVTLEDGKLAFQRRGGHKISIVPIGANRFAFVDDARTQLEFAVAGTAVTGFELFRNDGSRVVATRNP
ncbi:S41 family peptidase [Sphingomonas sp.]|uniref:S41 family peptidase n=1 Tax=Sphingomonas sp. TaxID=28214 RepID=UPI00286E81E9|nr:S41 family peptidase [Sphingomonas sp.]